MRQATGPEAEPPAGTEGEIFSERLTLLLDDILAGKAPNAGRFCGNCYHPLATGREVCPHCGLETAERATVDGIPAEVLEMHKLRRKREGLVVRTFAWGGLTIGVIVALLPLAFADVSWWTLALFFGLLAFFYLLSANLANSVGDALGYAWGRTTVRGRWEKLVAARDG